MDSASLSRSVRHLDRPRASAAAAGTLSAIEGTLVRQSVARALVLPVRLVAAVIAGIAAAVAGLVYIVLLPVCGVASVAEGAAKASWRAARDSLRVSARVTLPQD